MKFFGAAGSGAKTNQLDFVDDDSFPYFALTFRPHNEF